MPTIVISPFARGEPAMMGRVASLLALGSVGTTPIGSMIVGFLIDAWSARAAMTLGAIACLAGGTILLLSGTDRGRLKEL